MFFPPRVCTQVLRLSLQAEVKAGEAKARRSKTTGSLVVTMPKVNPDQVRKEEMVTRQCLGASLLVLEEFLSYLLRKLDGAPRSDARVGVLRA